MTTCRAYPPGESVKLSRKAAGVARGTQGFRCIEGAQFRALNCDRDTKLSRGGRAGSQLLQRCQTTAVFK